MHTYLAAILDCRNVKLCIRLWDLRLVHRAFVAELLVVTCKQEESMLILNAAANAKAKIRLLEV